MGLLPSESIIFCVTERTLNVKYHPTFSQYPTMIRLKYNFPFFLFHSSFFVDIFGILWCPFKNVQTYFNSMQSMEFILFILFNITKKILLYILYKKDPNDFLPVSFVIYLMCTKKENFDSNQNR